MKSDCLFGWEWIAQYIADVTNVYMLEAATPQFEADAVQQVIAEMAKLQKDGYALTAEKVKELLFNKLGQRLLVCSTPKAAKKIDLPKGEQLSQNNLAQQLQEAELQKHSSDPERYRLRERNIQLAGRLVAAAKTLEGYFRWVRSGPSE